MDNAYEKAKAFFEERWDNEDIKVHSACVIDCCRNMVRNTDLNPIVFDIAGWLHDLGRKDDKDRHHEIGVEYLDGFLRLYPEFGRLKPEIKDCILNHRRKQVPQTIYGRIMQVADKLSAHHNDWINFSKQS